MKHIKAVFTVAAGVYGKSVKEPKVIEDSKEFVTFDDGSKRIKVFKESFNGLMRTEWLKDTHQLFQRVVWCEPKDVDLHEVRFLEEAERHFSVCYKFALDSLKSIKKERGEEDVQ